MARKNGLGRGLDSLIPIGVLEETEEVEREVADRKAAREKAANKTGKNSSKSNDVNEKNSADAQKIEERTEAKKGSKQQDAKGPSRNSKTQGKGQVNTKADTDTKINAKAIKTDKAVQDLELGEQSQDGDVKLMESEILPKEEDTLTESGTALPMDEKADSVSIEGLETAAPLSADMNTAKETVDAAPDTYTASADATATPNSARANTVQEADGKLEVSAGTVTLKLTDIEPNREQPRKEFNEDALQELADSIKIHGVIQPLLVQKKGEYYEIIAGERRWRAAKIAGLREVPVVVREYTPREVMEVSLIENIQREDLNAIEEAKAYQRLIQEFHLKQEEIAVKISKSRTAIANTMRLLKLDERVQTMLIEDEISSGHARALLPLEDGDLQYQAAQKIASESLSVRETEKLIKLLLMPPKEEPPKEEARDDSFIYHALEEKMKTIMGTKVTIHKKDNNKGRIEIEYYSPEELERITDLIETIRQG